MTKEQSLKNTKVKRMEHNPWRDRRVLLGIAVVLSSAVLGGGMWLATTATEAYWVLTEDVKAGEPLSGQQVRRVEVSAPEDVQTALLPASGALPTGVWAHDHAAGHLVARSAIREEETRGQRLPLRIAIGAMPSELTFGDIVNVWVGPGQNSRANRAHKILTDVKVVHVSQDVGAAERTVLVDVGPAGPTPEVIAAIAESYVTVVFVR